MVVLGADAELCRERQVGAIATLLVPTLHGGPDGTGDDGHVEKLRDPPLVGDLKAEPIDLLLAKGLLASNILVILGILGNESCLPEKLALLMYALRLAQVVDSLKELAARDALQGIRDPSARG